MVIREDVIESNKEIVCVAIICFVFINYYTFVVLHGIYYQNYLYL